MTAPYIHLENVDVDFPIFNASMGAAGTFGLYGVICVAGFLFIRKYLPETKRKSLEEIERELAK